jgi:signal transduction histidine kinase
MHTSPHDHVPMTSVSDSADLGRTLAAIPQPLVLLGSDLRVRFANSAFLSLLGGGLGLDQVRGVALFELDERRWAHPTLRESLEGLREDNRVDGLRLPYLGRDEQQRTFVVSGGFIGDGLVLLAVSEAVPVRPVSDAANVGASAKQDLIERTAELAGAVEQLASANAELEAFGYSVSHDLRAPLRAVEGFSLLVLDEFSQELSQEGRRYLGIVRDATADMGAMIDGLLAFSGLGHRGMTFEPAPLRPLVDRALELRRDEIAMRRVEVEIGALPTLPVDAILMRQVFDNLVSNALKYTRDSDKPRIEIEAREGETMWEISVADNGVGFDMAHAAKLFGVFNRLHRAEDYEGVGVGLALTRRIVERHGGTIRAEASQGVGATFFVTLPKVGMTALREAA